MANVVILGGGMSGHTAALFARKKLGRAHNVTVVTPNSKWNWIPSNIWVGVGLMKPKQVTFELAPVYKKKNIIYEQAKAVSIHPDGNGKHASPFVTIEYTSKEKNGQTAEIEYDYLINATGPKLKFEATPGLGPDDNSLSVCTADHAEHASNVLSEKIDRMKKGEKQRFLIGTGNGMCTCQGAAFEYLFNVEYELNKHGVRDMADITYISNESMLGDFGVGGLHIKRGGYITHSKIFAESLFAERGIDWITSAHIFNVDKDKVEYELLDGTKHDFGFDFTMLIPPFSGVGLKTFNQNDEDITGELFAPNGFMFVDAEYTSKPFEDWKASDWPKTYQNPKWKNIFAAGIAFAPPHPISKPMKSPNGTPISPTPPRTGMPSSMIGKATALSICDMILGKTEEPTHTASMTQIGAACVASAGNSLFRGSAVAMTMFPIVHDFEKYPEYGRDIRYSFGEIGLSSHWIKILLHHGFIYKAKANPFWFIIPE
jgi:sulfide:quinone oxidoreductase